MMHSHKPRHYLQAGSLLLCLVALLYGQAQPPQETGPFRQPELVELRKLDKTIKLDIRYATAHNFLGRPVYTKARAYLQRPAAEALVRVSKRVRQQGYGLVVFDGYRPWAVTKILSQTPPKARATIAAAPSIFRSTHCRPGARSRCRPATTR
jgi:D-alanyl-D-alanine dipeptidase